MRKRSKNAVRRQRPATSPANTYRVHWPALSMADIREYLAYRRENKRPATVQGYASVAAAIALVALTSGCSLAVRAELLNPLNKSGRAETTTSDPRPAPSASPTPSPTPEAQR